MRTGEKWLHLVIITVLSVLVMVLVYFSRGMGSFVPALARYALFVPVVYAAHFFGISGGIAASLSLSTLLLPLVVGRALTSGAEIFGMDIAVAVVFLNLVGYFWGALAGSQRRQRRIYQQLHDLAQHLTLDPRETASMILDAALINVSAGGGFVLLTMDPDFSLRALATRGLADDQVRRMEESFRDGRTVIEWAVTGRRGLILNRVAEDPRFESDAPHEAPRNMLIVPLTRGEEICGGIVLFDRSGWEDFSPADLEWLVRLAEWASVALENARLYAVSQAVAEENARYYKELKVYANELDRLVDERTRALTKALAELRAAEEDLMQTSRLAAVGELAGRVAHEILNPLTGILGRVQSRLTECELPAAQQPPHIMAAILRTWREHDEIPGGLAAYFAAASTTEPGMTCGREDLRDLESLINLDELASEQKRTDLVFLEAQTLRLVRMVESLRELGRRQRTVGPVVLKETIRETREVIGALLERTKAELILEGLEDLPPVAADPDELVQVFTNLLRNGAQAVEAAGRGGGRITVQGRVTGGRVEIRIRDDGIGISPENLEKLFESGFTTKPREQGTGLGLSISRRFVRECHGDVELEESNSGEGTTFLVWFPVKDEPYAAAAADEEGEDGHGYRQ